MSLRREAHSVR